MIQKNKLLFSGIATIIAIVVIVTACKKLDQSEIPANPGATVTIKGNPDPYENMTRIRQKTYNISSAETYKTIKQFREEMQDKEHMQARLVAADSISMDSTIWLLEATLNFEFDQNLEGHFDAWLSDTLIVEMDVNLQNMKLSADDIEEAYLSMQAALNDSAGSNYKLKFIDLEGYISNGKVLLVGTKLQLGYYSATCPDFAVGPNFGPFPANNTYITMPAWPWASIAGNCAVTVSPQLVTFPEAIINLNAYRNCSSYSHNCPRTPEDVPCWTNIVSYPGVINAYLQGQVSQHPNELWTSDPQDYLGANNWWCTLSNITITGSQLNSFLQNQILYAKNQIVTYASPTYLEPIDRYINYQVHLGQNYFDVNCNCNKSDKISAWYMDVKFGTFNCINLN